jgi:hypothetical protein
MGMHDDEHDQVLTISITPEVLQNPGLCLT